MPWASKTADAAVYKCQPNDVAKKTRKHKIRAARSQNAGKFQAKKWLKYADSESNITLNFHFLCTETFANTDAHSSVIHLQFATENELDIFVC